MLQDVYPTVSLKQHSIWQGEQPPEPCAVVIFGATGDLTQRKLLPTLAHLFKDHPLRRAFSVVAVARRPMSHEVWREMALHSINTYMPEDDQLDEATQRAFAERLFYCQADFDDREGYGRLADLLDQLDREQGTQGNRLFYLATPPTSDPAIVSHLGTAGLARPALENGNGESWTRLIVEKPFGRDLTSASALNRELARVFRENQTYRIDHYLGKETVQNLLALRFANGIFEPLWNQKYIDHVQILVAESLGIGSRAAYYEESGAIRDIVQNHMLQILCLVAMEPPVAFEADAIRDEKVKVLRTLPLLSPEEVAQRSVRGQYNAGAIDGAPVVGYKDEQGVVATSMTESYVALKLFIENWRWAGVPFYLRTGKHLPKRSTEVTIQFKRVPHQLYNPTKASR